VRFLDMSVAGKSFTKFSIRNGADRPRVIWIELHGHDYTLLPLESLELIIWGRAEIPQIEVTEDVDWSSVLLSPPAGESVVGEYLVHQNGVLLDSGHQRQEGMKAGLTY
jgi:hypothetical protein